MENNNLHEKTDSRNMNLYGKKTVAVPPPKPEIGIDTVGEYTTLEGVPTNLVCEIGS